ncbi:MAG: Gfo/Idh/MocA family oxidoreductase [Lachnospiraceae bacterium]|nr:Gfo/Idh/MocA family oxidoreductase [Lachnospiraceae bacterium]
MKMGIIGAGAIASCMARTIGPMQEVEAYAIASRNLEKARSFADEYGFEKAYGSYEEMVADPEVELVYIATPHSHHYEHMKLCIEHGKPVLCEKAFTQNAAQAREILALAEEKKVFVTEAIWTRYMPMRWKLDEILASGVIGEPLSISATLSYVISQNERIYRPELAGGILLDCGVYPINFASMVFGDDFSDVKATALLNDLGVDMSTNIALTWPDGKTAYLHADARVADDRQGIVRGSKGYVVCKNINNCEGLEVYDTNHQLVASYETPAQITGYEYEVLSCMKALQEGALECPEMPHSETIRIMELMDRIREQIGVVYPNER